MKVAPIVFVLILSTLAVSQQLPTTRVIRFNGQASQGIDQIQTMTFSVFAHEAGITPLWTETQQVILKNGKFTVLLGSTEPEGLPLSIFASGEARWLEWRIEGQAPQSRTQLVAVPYALNAANAETFAGHSISEFVLSSPGKSAKPESSRAQPEGQPAANGIANMVAKFSGATNTTPSQILDNGLSVGIGTTAPTARLEVAGDIKISGTGNALVFPDGTRFTATASGLNAKNIEQVRYADQFAEGSHTGGIAEAYADCPSSGCKIQLGQDVIISTPQVLTVMMGKPLLLDLAGRAITASNTTGVGLTFTSENINARTPMAILNGTLKCTWDRPGLTGFAWVSSVNVSIEHVDVRDCGTPGSTAIVWDFVEDAHMDAVAFRFNAGAIRIQNASNQNSFRNVWFDSNVDALIVSDSSGITIEDCLVQSNTGTRAVQIVTSAGNNATTFRIHKCHFENNGDSSAASRNIYAAPAPSQMIIGLSVEDNVFTAGAYGAAGTSFELSGSQNLSPLLFKNNQYNGYQRGKVASGLRNTSLLTAIGENLGAGDSAYDVGINTHGLSGLSFAPQDASRSFQIFAGWPGNYDGFLQFWDTTSNSSLLSYSSSASSWMFERTAVFDSTVVLNNSQILEGYSDRQSTQTWAVNSSNGSAHFNGNVQVGGGLAIACANALNTTAQTGTGSIVMSNGATLSAPNIGDATATSLSLNGQQMSDVPLMVYSATVMNPASNGLQARLTLDRPIVVTRFQFVINSGMNSGCSTEPVLLVTDGRSQLSLRMTNNTSAFDSGTVNIRFPAGAQLDILVATAAAGCASIAQSGNATVQYRMQ